jgi:hypothetical protein
MGISQTIENEILGSIHAAAWDTPTHHEHVKLATLSVFPLRFAGVSVFLLVATMEFQQLLFCFFKVIGAAGHDGGNATAQAVARCFHALNG